MVRLAEAPASTPSSSSLIQHMFTSQVETHLLPVPPLEEQNEMVRAIDGQLDRCNSVLGALSERADYLRALDSSLLAKAFRGELVPQDPNDEPASVLLERIRTGRGNQPSNGRGRRSKGSVGGAPGA